MNKFSCKLFLMLFLCCNSISFAQNDELINWSSDYKLQWADFLGKLDPEVFAYAKTSYKIEVVPENVLVDENNNMLNFKDLNVVAVFYKKHSWSVSSDKELLKHEQLHFDIAELFARKIRKRFSELKNNNESTFSLYYTEYKKLWKMCRSFQEEYDNETNHGASSVENKKWILNVKKEIVKLEGFSK